MFSNRNKSVNIRPGFCGGEDSLLIRKFRGESEQKVQSETAAVSGLSDVSNEHGGGDIREDTLRMRCYKPGLLCYRKSIFSAPTVAIIPCLLRTDSEIYLYLGNNLLQSEAVCRL